MRDLTGTSCSSNWVLPVMFNAEIGPIRRVLLSLRTHVLTFDPEPAPRGRCDTFLLVSSWDEFRNAEPEMAGVVQQLFDAHRHKTIATVRSDGSPRISGIECSFGDGRLTFGSMEGARKLADLHRDDRFALHSATVDPVDGDEGAWPGEAKIAGRAIPDGSITGEGAPGGEMFVADVTEVVFVHLDSAATALIVEWWTPDGGRRSVERT